MGDPNEVVVNERGFAVVPVEVLHRAVLHVLEDAGVSGAELSVTCLDDDGIRILNRDYLDHDRPTDVLAFSLGEAGGVVLGDVYVGVEQAERQAGELDVPLSEEIVRLAIHGTLHVLGHDHPSGPGRLESPMFLLQERLLGEVLGRD